jgi:glycine cleavage system H protein
VIENVPDDLQYTKSHEWVRKLSSGQVEVGITHHAQESLGDLVFVEVPQTDRHVAAGEACAVVESVKAASDVYSPSRAASLRAMPTSRSGPSSSTRIPTGQVG